MMTRVVKRMDPRLKRDFFKVHCEKEGLGWCACVAWWVPTWEGWGERTADENHALREALWEKGEYDGYIAYVDGAPAGWCQVGERDRLEKLLHQFELPPQPGTWAITCFAVVPAHRGAGLATFMLSEVLADLRGRGVERIEAFPKRLGEDPEAGELWTGPEGMYLAAGFQVERDDAARPILSLDLK